MVFFNYATMQMAAKIVYYGPGLCGKTTNLHHIYSKTSPQSRGEMVSLETETDRTLFFDLLPIDVGVIGGFKTRLQLYTVPGQVFYNTTRKLVLKGVDGIVFVADSQRAMLDANAESFRNLRDNLREIGLDLDEIPLVVQLNKRDLPSVSTVDEMLNAIDPARRFDHVESIASSGAGVFETLKMISKLTLRTLRRRMTGEEPVKTQPRAAAAQFRVQQQDAPPRPSQATTARTEPIPAFGSKVGTAPAPAVQAPAASATTTVAEPLEFQMPETLEPPLEEVAEDAFSESTLAKTADVDTRILADAPVDEPPPSTQYIPPPSLARAPDVVPPPVAPPAPVESPVAPPPQALTVPPPPAAFTPEPEIDFAQTEKPAKAPEPKHVKVRSSIDIMAELEALRKRATTTQPAAPKPRKEMTAADVTIPTPKPKRDVHRTVNMKLAPETASRAKSVRVTVSFENDEGVVNREEQSIDLADASDVRSLSLDVKIALD
jgi:signal recognition particle receptor subunit beta